jgi:hypothetical protein
MGFTKLAEIADNIEDERIAIVDDDNQNALGVSD